MECPILFDCLKSRRLILASGSPRRRELLDMLGLGFTVAESRDIDESYPASLPARNVPEYLARQKADAYRHDLASDAILITADTVVILDGEVLGKPADRDEAIAMLSRLSGHTHEVVTGVTLTSTDSQKSFSALTEVDFAPLTHEEIAYYVDRYHPLDKAGAYGIQEWIGAIGIRGIRGSYYNVMGLPIHRLYDALKSFCDLGE